MEITRVSLENYWDFRKPYTIEFPPNGSSNLVLLIGNCSHGIISIFRGIQWCLTGDGRGKHYPWKQDEQPPIYVFPEIYSDGDVTVSIDYIDNRKQETNITRYAQHVKYKAQYSPENRDHTVSIKRILTNGIIEEPGPLQFLSEQFDPDLMGLFFVNMRTSRHSFKNPEVRKSLVRIALNALKQEKMDEPLEAFEFKLCDSYSRLRGEEERCFNIHVIENALVLTEVDGERVPIDTLEPFEFSKLYYSLDLSLN